MDFEEIMTKHAATMAAENGSEGATAASVTPEEKVEAENPAAGNPTESAASAESTPPAETPASEPAQASGTEPAKEAEQFDPISFLKASFGDEYDSVDALKSTLDKVKELEEVRTKLEQKEQENPFANQLVQKLNELYKKPDLTEEQVDSFWKLAKLGDLSKLDPFEVKVQRLIFEGYPRAAAERRVNSQYNLTVEVEGDHLSDDEIEANKIKLEDGQIDLKLSSKDDLKFLEDKIAAFEKVDDNAAQTRILQDKADKLAYENKLAPVADQLAKQFISNRTVTFQLNKEDVNYSLPIDDSFQKEASEAIKSYFLETGDPVNDQNVGTVKKLILGEILVDNLQTKILPSIAADSYNKGYKAAKDEVSNSSGLPATGAAPVTQDSISAQREQQRKVAMGEDEY